MEETSVGIAASAAVASLADWVDLDGNLLLVDDPFEGLELGPDCRWLLADRPGPRPDATNLVTPIPNTRFVWITWWTRSWTNPLHSGAGRPSIDRLDSPSASREGRSRSSSTPTGTTRERSHYAVRRVLFGMGESGG
jgi:hypothetical protein